MPFTYTLNIPAAGNNPSNDQPDMQTNTNSINSIIAVDHADFSNAKAGYHTVVHCVDNVSDPANVAGVGEFYAKTISGDVQAFFRSASGVITQLTGGNAPSPGANGYVYLDGGLLLQWGVISGTHSGGTFNGGDTGTVTFATSNISFPNNCYVVLANPLYTTNAPDDEAGMGNVAINTASISKTSFSWTFISNSKKWTKFFWIAIGN